MTTHMYVVWTHVGCGGGTLYAFRIPYCCDCVGGEGRDTRDTRGTRGTRDTIGNTLPRCWGCSVHENISLSQYLIAVTVSVGKAECMCTCVMCCRHSYIHRSEKKVKVLHCKW